MVFYLCFLTDELLDDRPVSCQVLGNLWPISQQIDFFFHRISLQLYIVAICNTGERDDGDMVEFLTHLRYFHIQVVFFLCAKEKAKVRQLTLNGGWQAYENQNKKTFSLRQLWIMTVYKMQAMRVEIP